MILKDVTLKNFRGIANCKIQFHPQMNIIIGNNGVGKTSILDACALLLNRALPFPQKQIVFNKKTDIRKNERSCDIGIAFSSDMYRSSADCTVDYSILRNKPTHYKQNFSEQKNDNIEKLYDNNDTIDLPLIAYYRAERAVMMVPMNITIKSEFGRINAYDNCLTGKTDFRLFFEWYRNQDDIINENLRETGMLVDSLQPVKEAIQKFTGFHFIKLQRGHPHLLLLTKMLYDGTVSELDMELLSQGEKLYIALIGDIARRLTMLNPNLTDPLEGKGVIFIDEIELHLHPKWQREILPKLVEIFPNCQFIVTTHSPQVISSVSNCSVFVLNQEALSETTNIKPLKLEHVMYGKTSDQILEYIMDSSKRDFEIEEQIKYIYTLLDDKKVDKAKQAIKILKEKIGNDTEITKLNAWVKRIEILGK